MISLLQPNFLTLFFLYICTMTKEQEKLILAIDFVKSNQSNFIGAVCIGINVPANYIKDLAEQYPELVSEIYLRIEANIIEQVTAGDLPVQFAKMILQNYHNWEEKRATTIVAKKERPKITFTFDG